MTHREPSEDTAGSKVDKRTDAIENGELRSASGHTFIVPDPRLIDALETESSGKVEYFPTDREGFESDTHNNQHGVYTRFVIDGLLARIDQEYPDVPIALRGVATSINGDVYSSGYDGLVHDATTVAAQGVEKTGDFNVVGYEHGTRASDNLRLKHMHTYALQVGMYSSFDAPDVEKSLFPAILVYRSDMLKATDGYGAEFKEGVDPKEALLKVYITDKAN